MAMTPNKEDYLKIIFELGGDAKKVTNKEILAGLNVSAASVTEMVNKLVKENYVNHTPYQGIQLTGEGAREAALLVRNHRLWEVFLVDKLHYQFNTVHPEAEQLEHVTNHDLAERLADFLGHPTRCPHGGIIPNAKGEFEQQSHIALETLQVGETAIIDRVLDDNDLLKYTLEIGLSVGDSVTLQKVGLFESPLTVFNNTSQTEIKIGLKAAQHIFVTPQN
ncbi:metal-dependent transcriptional regulator [Latilactobacillus curvatus]|uniref:Manganese transport regulator n=2 Tax=Latilactobacillus curvatus TaxID=28038 RepID=A0A1X7QM90_LATCU|nr:Cro/Cl family transcriptional regulator [Latilactobacillus curvatus]AXN36463.1 metal-dependent transcriptional regulator [Latilactobacillus curvatus]AZP95823.1 metal-dependent transcriptional regulator [Latilactobacillus curvatus]MCT1214993.1 metal-dependent transcriptional regulator [Latilactobacillus curvatus]MCT2879688.1 metal-dependent transcriptional regulator [Latilactobacillus curvatus]